MNRRYFLVLSWITIFSFGSIGWAAVAGNSQPVVGWTQHQLAAFPDISDESVSFGPHSLQPLTLAMADFDGDRVPDLSARVQRSERVLEDDLHTPPEGLQGSSMVSRGSFPLCLEGA